MGGESLLADIVRRVDTRQVAQRMVSLFRSEIDAYKRLPESVVSGQILDISESNVALFFRTLVEERELNEDELVPFRESARHRASEGLPLEDLLHAYRLGGRLGWEALVDASSKEEQAALLPSVARLMEYVDRVSDAVTETYHDERRHLMSEEERRLYDLFQQIVAGVPLDPPLRDLAAKHEIEIAEDYRPFGLALPGAAAHAHAQAAADMRRRRVLALNEGDRIVGVIASDAEPEGFGGEGSLVAVGEPTPRGELAAALDDTRLLLELGVRRGRTGRLRAEDFIPELLLARSPALAALVVRRALGPLEDYAERRSADLLETLETFVECDLDRRRAAEQLHVHPNTLDYRLKRVEELTGLRPSAPEDLLLITLALKQRAFARGPGGTEVPS
ncbi:MAG: hypothetical protein QOE08_1663 [Thermoleophilaceae bacterium]|nr:hypothetical protein [Thermoleophilaceae bacterium]